MKAALRHAGALLLLVAIAMVMYVALLASPALRSFPILFYRGVALAVLVGMATGLAGAWAGRRCGVPMLAVPAALTSMAGALCFLVLFPVTIDRSVSTYLLATIGNAPADARTLEARFVRGYVMEMHAIDRRIAEQVRSGNVRVGGDGRVFLTSRGARFVAMSRRTAALFDTDPRVTAGSRAQFDAGATAR